MGLSDIAKAPVSHGVEPHDLETGLSLRFRLQPSEPPAGPRRGYRASGFVLGSNSPVRQAVREGPLFAQTGRPPQRLRTARLGPVAGGPDSNVLIEILDASRLMLRPRRPAPDRVFVVICTVGPGRMPSTEFSATPSRPRGPQSRSPICPGASELGGGSSS